MIFVTLGSQMFQFDRLLKKIDELIDKGVITDEVYAQIGASTYLPRNYKYTRFMDREEFSRHIENASLIVTHGGTGVIIGAVKKGKKVIAVPRLAKYGEHVDDHQLQLLQEFEELGIICSCFDVDKLDESFHEVRNKEYKSYVSNTGAITDSIEEFLEKTEKNDKKVHLIGADKLTKKKLTLYDIPEFVEPELNKLRGLYFINLFLIFTDFLMPQYFGIHLGYDITCTRLANMVLAVYILFNLKLVLAFVDSVVKCTVAFPLFAYLFVAGYTMVFRADVNAFMMVFLEILTFYMLLFGIRYVIGVIKTVRIILACAYFLGFYGLLEYVVGHSLYLQFLSTLPNMVTNDYRSGHYRIMGPCGHPLGFGLLLLLFLAIACYDLERDEIYLFKRPVLLIVLFVDIFFTGSRSTLGLAVIELGIILLFSGVYNIKKSLTVILILGIVAGLFLFLNAKNSFGRYLLMQIASVIDTALGTRYSEYFGAEIGRLTSSEEYREYLPRIFGLDWLSPVLGRGVKKGFGAEFFGPDGTSVYIHSVDNYYIVQYIKYAYPGMISYLAFIVSSIVSLMRNGLKYRCGLFTVIGIGVSVYFVNLWWVDALQTLKFTYVFLALTFGAIMHLKNLSKESGEIKA